jgi:hypothetical protein
MVEDLKGNDTFEPCRRVSDNVREIAVQGKQDCIHFLGLGDNDGIPRFSWQVVLQPHNFMPGLLQ